MIGVDPHVRISSQDAKEALAPFQQTASVYMTHNPGRPPTWVDACYAVLRISNKNEELVYFMRLHEDRYTHHTGAIDTDDDDEILKWIRHRCKIIQNTPQEQNTWFKLTGPMNKERGPKSAHNYKVVGDHNRTEQKIATEVQSRCKLINQEENDLEIYTRRRVALAMHLLNIHNTDKRIAEIRSLRSDIDFSEAVSMPTPPLIYAIVP